MEIKEFPVPEEGREIMLERSPRTPLRMKLGIYRYPEVILLN